MVDAKPSCDFAVIELYFGNLKKEYFWEADPGHKQDPTKCGSEYEFTTFSSRGREQIAG